MPAAKRSLFQSTVIRLLKSGSKTSFVIVNHPEQGWASYGVEYPTLVEAHPRAQAEA